MRRLTKKEYKTILRNQKNTGIPYTKKERAKLKKITFEEVAICQDGFIVCGADENLNWFANNIPSRCFRVSDVLKGRNIQ